MANTRQCSQCGEPISGAGLAGNCARCLAGRLLDPELGGEDELPPVPVLRCLGDYELLEEIARGGMGVVYRARQASLDREVAVKLLRDSALANAEAVRRFHAEASSAAKLHHPNIVAIHEVGSQDGELFLAMRMVEGPNLAQLTREGPLPPRRAAELVAKIAAAVQHAHERGVLHRDLKPSNVLLDAADEPHVTDFGLARPLDSDSSLTLTGQLVGTPAFMAPEQADSRKTAGPAADVYSLGALLFDLLTGRPPFVGGTVPELLRHLIEQEPVSPRLLNPAVPVDLASVCLKCLGKEPGQRYLSAQALADDLGRFLRNEPTLARPATTLEKASRWCRRKPALAAAVGVAVMIGLVGLTGVFWQWRRAEQHAIGEKRHRELAERNELATRQSLYAADMSSVQQALAQHNLGRARRLLRDDEPRAGQPDLRGWEWWYYTKQCLGDDVVALRPGGNRVTSLVSSRHLNGVVAGWEDGTVDLWDLASQRPVARLVKETNAIHWLTSDAEGRYLTTLAFYGQVKLWEITDISKLKLVRTFPTNYAQALSARNQLIALTAVAGDLWQVPDGDFGLVGVGNWENDDPLIILPESGDAGVFSEDGRLLATGSWKGSVKIWNVGDWSLQHTLAPTGRVVSMAFSPDGQRLVTCNWAGGVLLWDVASGRQIGEFKGHSGRAYPAKFSPDGRILATSSEDQTIGLWDVLTQRELVRLKGHERDVHDVAFSPDGQWLASGRSKDGTLRIWKVDPSSHTNLALSAFSAPVIAPDSRTAACANEHGQVNLWDLETKRVRGTVPSEPNPVGFSSDGKLLITATVAKVLPFYANPIAGLKFWNVGSQTLDHVVEFSPSNQIITAATLAPDGATLATGDPGGNVILWDVNAGTIRKRLAAGSVQIWNLVFTADSKILAIGLQDRIKLWNLETGTQIVVAGGGSPVAFSPDGSVVATGRFHEISLWRTATGEELQTIQGHREQIMWLAFAKDGRTLASAGEEIKLWNVATGREVANFMPDSSPLFVDFSPDGRRLTGGKLGEAYVWNAAIEGELFKTSEARVNFLRAQIRPRDPTATSNQIDLSAHYNAALTESWHPGGGKSDLAELPQGLQNFAGVTFDVRGLIQVGSETRNGERYPPRIRGIALNAACRHLHFLHSAINGAEMDGNRIGSYVVHYADGQSREIPIVVGRDVADWFSQSDEREKSLTTAWTGRNAASRESGQTIRLFKTTWKNPIPEGVIESIDLVSSGAQATPFLVAVTAE